MSEVEASLARLKTDWIDLYQIHTPDPLTPMEETLRALDDLVKQGKVRHIGCSNHHAWQVVESAWISRTLGLNAFVSCQDEYSLLVRGPEAELIPAMRAYGLGLLPFPFLRRVCSPENISGTKRWKALASQKRRDSRTVI